MSSKDRGIFQDEKAATVVFGTLLIILVTITLVSGLALAASLTMKQNMERQALLDAAKNENLKIVTIHPYENPEHPSYWEDLNITVMNLDTRDSTISAFSINGNYLMNYFFIDEDNKLSTIGDTAYPEIYNSSNKIDVPAGKSVQICVGGIHTSEEINVTGVPMIVALNKSPGKVYSTYESRPPKVHSNSNFYFTYGTDFTVDSYCSNLTIPPGSTMTSGTNYTVEYTTFIDGNMGTPDISDINVINLPTTDSISTEIMSDLTNIFSKRFMPPEPIADLQVKSETWGGIEHNYLLLDASNSNAPDGFITSYNWEIYNKTIPGAEYLNGTKVRSLNASNVTIDLTVTNNYGMKSRLSDISGNITIPP